MKERQPLWIDLLDAFSEPLVQYLFELLIQGLSVLLQGVLHVLCALLDGL